MRVLVIGSGGREHALVWKIRQSPDVTDLYCAPGNAGISEIADCVPISASDTIELADFAEKLKIDLTVVGPELPLSLGIVDEFEKRGLRIFGPNRLAAEIEGSKVWSKEFMRRHEIPTAASEVVSDPESGLEAVERIGLPCVIKADGLASGKGVMMVETSEDAEKAFKLMFDQKVFGAAGERVLVEERLVGEEISFIVLTDGRAIIPLATAKDYKKIFDQDRGPNTGGMGAHTPAVVVSGEIQKQILQQVILPTIKGLAAENRRFRGCLYAGLMLTEDGPKVLEYNCRMGDPETQPVLMRLESDLVPFLVAAAEGNLGDLKAVWRKEATSCVVLVSKGYPGPFEKGKPIEGLDELPEDVVVFHAGTNKKNGSYVTAGGRVLNVCARAPTLRESLEKAYAAVAAISWDGKFFRKDIGYRALAKKKSSS